MRDGEFGFFIFTSKSILDLMAIVNNSLLENLDGPWGGVVYPDKDSHVVINYESKRCH